MLITDELDCVKRFSNDLFSGVNTKLAMYILETIEDDTIFIKL